MIKNTDQHIKTVQRKLDILARAAIDAGTSCAVWRHFIDPEIHSEYGYQLDTYIPSFNAIRRTAEISSIICTARFADRSKGTVSFPKVADYLMKNDWNRQLVSEASEKFESQNDVWRKVKLIRDKVFAHAAQSTGEVEVYKEAGITPDEFSLAIETALEISIDLQCAAGQDIYRSCRGDANEIRRDLEKLMSNLKNGRRAVLAEIKERHSANKM